MKFLVLLVVLVVALLLWQRGRRRDSDADTPPANPQARRPTARGTSSDPMAVCAHCQLHLPASEALRGRHGVYCSEAHRRAHEG